MEEISNHMKAFVSNLNEIMAVPFKKPDPSKTKAGKKATEVRSARDEDGTASFRGHRSDPAN